MTVRILATVEKTKLIAGVTKALPAVQVSLGNTFSDLHAQIETKDKQQQDGMALLESTLAEIDPIKQLVRIGLYSTKPLISD